MNILKNLAAVVVLTACVGCSESKPVLYVFGWADYFDENVIASFEKEYGCRVDIATFDDNESMLAKMLAGGTGYDVLVPSSYAVQALADHGLIVRLDMSMLPNVEKNFDRRYERLIPGRKSEWSVPYAFSMTGVIRRKEKTPETADQDSWEILKDKAFTGRVCILNDIREVLGVGLKLCGLSLNSKNPIEIEKACDVMLPFKDAANKLDCVQYKTGLASGEFWIAMGYSSDALQLKQEGTDIEFTVPKEGSTACFDELVVASGGKHRSLAHAFIDWMYRPENAVANMRYACSAVPNSAMRELMTDDEKTNSILNVSDEIMSRLEIIQDVGESLDAYNKAWDRFMARRK